MGDLVSEIEAMESSLSDFQSTETKEEGNEESKESSKDPNTDSSDTNNGSDEEEKETDAEDSTSTSSNTDDESDDGEGDDSEDDEDSDEEVEEEEEEEEVSPKKDPTPTTRSLTVDDFKDQEFVTEDDFDEMARSHEAMNKKLNQVYKEALFNSSKILEAYMESYAPKLISQKAMEVINLNRAVDIFYEHNEDLKKHRDVVQKTFGKIAKKNPKMEYSKLFPLLAKEVRKKLNLTEPAKKTKTRDDAPPRLPRKGSDARAVEPTTKQKDPMLAELEAMDTSLGR